MSPQDANTLRLHLFLLVALGWWRESDAKEVAALLGVSGGAQFDAHPPCPKCGKRPFVPWGRACDCFVAKADT